MMNGVLLRKAVLGVKVNCKSMATSVIKLALLLVIVGAVAPQQANANSLSVGGGTLNWNMSTSSNQSCGPSATSTIYYFSSFSFTSSTGVVTSFSASDDYFQWNSTCASGYPNGPYPSTTLSLTGSTFVITFTPQNGGSGSATYTGLTAQTITFSNPGAQIIGTPLTLSATASSGLVVSFASQTTSICTVSGATATFVAAGTCTIQATQAGNSTYAAATAVSQSFTVSAASLQSQTITFSNPGTQTVGTPLTLSASASSGLTVSFASQTTGICTVSGTVATFVAAGSCTIQATEAGNSTYAAATAVLQSFTVQGAATLSVGNIPMFTNPLAPLTSTLTNSVITQASVGNIGIGTTAPGQKLEVNGNAQIDGALNVGNGGIVFPNGGGTQTIAYTGVTCGGDYAESVDVTGSRTNYEPGDVLVIDPDVSGKFLKSAEPYSTSVSGIYSTKPGTLGRRQTTTQSPDEVPMAVVGIVPAKVSAENGPIKRGDLLVSSSKIGYAMKGTDRSRLVGAVIGKAMGNLDTDTGVIEVLVTLQ
jgi:hypothetical protein